MKNRSRLLALALPFVLALPLAGCLLRADLRPRAGEQRVVLWDGVVLVGSDGAEINLTARTLVEVIERKGSECFVSVPGPASLRGNVDCVRLGYLVTVPTEVFAKPNGQHRFTVNSGILAAPKKEKDGFVEIGSEATRRFRGWVKKSALGVTFSQEWLAPMPSRFPWICGDGAYIYDAPKGKFRYWLPAPWCRVHVVEERDKWMRVEYVNQKMKVGGWVEADDLEPDPEPRFHQGSLPLRVRTASGLFARPQSREPFGRLEPGTAVWASTISKGRRLVQARLQRGEVIGWVEASSLGE